MAEQKPFRFGVNLHRFASRAELVDRVRRAEQFGYDIVCVADHLGKFAPFPALVAAAEATTRVRLGTFVLNAGFYNPVLLAREVASTDQLLDGRPTACPPCAVRHHLLHRAGGRPRLLRRGDHPAALTTGSLTRTGRSAR